MTPSATLHARGLAALLLAALLLAALAPGLAAPPLDARTLDARDAGTRVFDPATGEPVPLPGLAPPPGAPAPARSGGDLTLRQYLPRGATKLVRAIETDLELGSFVYQDGAYLIAADQVIVPEDDNNPQDTLLLPAQPTDMVTREGIGYVALRRNQGLHVIDAAEPRDLRLLGALPGRDLLAVAGDYAYAGASPSAVVVYDVSDPANPAEVGAQSAPGSAHGTRVDGQTLYVATGPDGLRVYDLADPAAPSEIGSFDTRGEFATYVAVRGNVAYLTGNFGLIALDVSDPAAPDSLGSFSTGGETTYELAFDGNTAYLPGLDGLRALDVSDPANITEEAFFPGSQLLSVSANVEGGTVLAAERFKGIYALVDQGTEFMEALFLENAGFSFRLFFDGDLLYVTDLAGRLRILDTGGASAEEISRIAVPPNTQEVVVSDGLAYVTDADFGGTGLTIVDVSDPADPQIVGGYGSPNQAFGLDVVGMAVYLSVCFEETLQTAHF